MKRVPRARLILKSMALASDATREIVRQRFARHGVDPAARTREEYVDLACAGAADTNRLARLRLELRERFLASPLTDAPRFARAFEALYRQAWTEWCALR